MKPGADLPTMDRSAELDSLETLIGRLLRVGVAVSIGVVLCGIGVSLVRHPDYIRNAETLARLTSPGAAFPDTLEALARELGAGRGRAIVTVGLLLLILTPVARVAACTVAFILRRDWTFTALTATVLLLLLLSFAFGTIG